MLIKIPTAPLTPTREKVVDKTTDESTMFNLTPREIPKFVHNLKNRIIHFNMNLVIMSKVVMTKDIRVIKNYTSLNKTERSISRI